MSFPSEKDTRQADYLSNRLLRNFRLLRKWARAEDIHALRLYDRDIPEIPLAVDLYGEGDGATLLIALYERPYEKDEAEESAWLDLMAQSAAKSLNVSPRRVHLKTRRKMKGLSQYDRGGDKKVFTVARESGLFFRVNFSDYLDTGLFLDHRPARAILRRAAAGKRVLNLFSYTGSFSVYAAAGGAAEVVSVDLSNTYLSWSVENFKLNELSEKVHTPVKADVMTFLKQASASGRTWDIIVADPPTFSNSTMTKEDFDVNRDWPALLAACAKVLAPAGTILFSTNSRQLKWDPALVELPWEDITEPSIPRDFRNRKIHRCWLLGNIEHTFSFPAKPA
ncbi:MAG TPA: class I SAM-dependent methyltransferase [Rectinemataceae bacterium]|nr:class I SAM-dependent methyltransferase [Rectinemataceae bacterium]